MIEQKKLIPGGDKVTVCKENRLVLTLDWAHVTSFLDTFTLKTKTKVNFSSLLQRE